VRSVAARVVINELYYDHPGTDTGHEFVELINTGALPADLSGTSIEFHNGTGTTWALVWRAPPGTMLVPGGIFLVGGDLVTPAPDAVITYALQNGPDSIRLITFDGAVLDVLGYGGLDDPAFVEGLGAPPVPAGKSVARVLDGVDGDDNSIDFAAASPTPGRHNVARDDAALVLAPETPVRAAKTRPGAERVVVRVENRGLAPIAAGDVELLLSDSTVAGVVRLAAGRNAADIAPGRGERVVVSAVLDGGYHWLEVSARYARDERDDNDRVRVLRRVGRVPVLVSEVWSSPRAGCPQFVELVNVGSEPVQVGGFALRDERARPVVIDADSLCLSPGAWLAVTADVARLSECVPRAPRDGVIGVRGAWPTFNRSGGDVADSVLVFDREGIVVDAVAYPAVPSASAGRSLERIDLFLHDNPAVWRLSDAPGGASPAAANRAYLDRPAPAGDVVVSPNPFFPARGDLLRVAMTPAPVVARVDAWVYDLDGRRVAALGGVASFPALLVWDGRGADGAPARPGIYVVAVEMLGVDGARLGVERVVVGCARASLP
jgi:hypothetical protein